MKDLAAVPPTRSRNRRWLAPALAVVIAASLLGFGPRLASGDSANLPEITAADLITRMGESRVDGVRGDVESIAELGLPEFIDTYAEGPGIQNFLSGTQAARVWLAPTGDYKVQLLGEFSETDVVRNAGDVWLWRSQGARVDHFAIPPDSDQGHAGKLATPRGVVEHLLAEVDPETAVSVVVGSDSVADRDAYILSVTPRPANTLIGEVRVAVDSQNYEPLRVQIVPRNATVAAYEIGYTSIEFGRIEPSTFAFVPPPGATVTERAVGEADGSANPEQPVVVGDSWTTVVVARVGLPDAEGPNADAFAGLLASAKPVSGPFGSGRFISTKLLNVVVLDDGRVAAGPVDEPTLLAAIPPA